MPHADGWVGLSPWPLYFAQRTITSVLWTLILLCAPHRVCVYTYIYECDHNGCHAFKHPLKSECCEIGSKGFALRSRIAPHGSGV